MNEAAAIIKETAHPDVNLIFGAVIDPNMGDEIRITVIATGFERTAMPRRLDRPAAKSMARPATAMQPAATPVGVRQTKLPAFAESVARQQSVSVDDLDIPAFLRHPRQ